MQKLRINGTMDEGVFMFQHTAIENIKTCIYRSLKSRPHRSNKANPDDDDICLERRVFTKVNSVYSCIVYSLDRGHSAIGSPD